MRRPAHFSRMVSAAAYSRAMGRAMAHLLLRLRQRAGLTQEELALKAGVSLGVVRLGEKSAMVVWLDDLYRLTKALGFDPVLFMFEVGQRILSELDHIPRMTEEDFLDEMYPDDRFARFQAQAQLEILHAIDPVPPAPKSAPRATRRSRSPRRGRRDLRARRR
jgi:transcriptional regulator with XRE-family HTH domain